MGGSNGLYDSPICGIKPPFLTWDQPLTNTAAYCGFGQIY